MRSTNKRAHGSNDPATESCDFRRKRRCGQECPRSATNAKAASHLSGCDCRRIHRPLDAALPDNPYTRSRRHSHRLRNPRPQKPSRNARPPRRSIMRDDNSEGYNTAHHGAAMIPLLSSRISGSQLKITPRFVLAYFSRNATRCRVSRLLIYIAALISRATIC